MWTVEFACPVALESDVTIACCVCAGGCTVIPARGHWLPSKDAPIVSEDMLWVIVYVGEDHSKASLKNMVSAHLRRHGEQVLCWKETYCVGHVDMVPLQTASAPIVDSGETPSDGDGNE